MESTTLKKAILAAVMDRVEELETEWVNTKQQEYAEAVDQREDAVKSVQDYSNEVNCDPARIEDLKQEVDNWSDYHKEVTWLEKERDSYRKAAKLLFGEWRNEVRDGVINETINTR